MNESEVIFETKLTADDVSKSFEARHHRKPTAEELSECIRNVDGNALSDAVDELIAEWLGKVII